MFSNQATEFSLEAPCRVVESIKADKLDNRFLVGTCRVQNNNGNSGNTEIDGSSNHLYVMRFHSEVNELGMDAALPHAPGPIQAMASCPTDASLALTCAERSPEATLWKIPTVLDGLSSSYGGGGGDDDDHDPYGDSGGGGINHESMEPLATLLPPPSVTSSSSSSSPTSPTTSPRQQQQQTHLVDVVWRDDGHDDISSASCSSGDVLTLDRGGTLTRWDVSNEGTTASAVRTVPSKSRSSSSSNNTASVLFPPPRAAWDPHANAGDAVAVTRGRAVDILDWRTNTDVPVGTVDSFAAHASSSTNSSSGVLDLDYNPNKPYVLATSGQDGLLKFWDLRSARRPLLVCKGGHSHWAWNVQYNPFHDQLVLSTGTDSIVNLWRVSSVSSAPLLTLNDETDNVDDDGGAMDHAAQADNNDHLLDDQPDKDENNDSNNSNNNNNNNRHHLSETAAPNVLVGRMEHTADACYGAAWGAADAWIYVTVGYDGKVVLSHVPSKEKYKILL